MDAEAAARWDLVVRCRHHAGAVPVSAPLTGSGGCSKHARRWRRSIREGGALREFRRDVVEPRTGRRGRAFLEILRLPGSGPIDGADAWRWLESLSWRHGGGVVIDRNRPHAIAHAGVRAIVSHLEVASPGSSIPVSSCLVGSRAVGGGVADPLWRDGCRRVVVPRSMASLILGVRAFGPAATAAAPAVHEARATAIA